MTAGMAGPGLDIIDLWSTRVPMAEAVAIDAGPAADTASSLAWRLDLPADRKLARDRLALAELSLPGLERALAETGPRLQRLAAPVMPGGVSFDAVSGTELPAAERELLQALRRSDGDATSASFGLFEQSQLPSWDEANAEVERLIEQARRFLTHYAWVETALAGRLIGQTAVTWTGDLRTVWPAPANAEEQQMHERSLRLALASRAATVRMVAVITTGAVTIIPLLATPGSAVLALSALWKFVRRVRAELERPKPLNQEQGPWQPIWRTPSAARPSRSQSISQT